MRKNLIMSLVFALRQAENEFERVGDDIMKTMILDIVENANLTVIEKRLFEVETHKIGI